MKTAVRQLIITAKAAIPPNSEFNNLDPMFIKILIGLVAVVAIFSVVAAFQSPTFRVSRSATISTPPEVVFAHVNDLHKWEEWSPWAKLDPAMKQVYEGAEAGVGSSYTWSGNNEVGEGRNTITESRP